MARSRRAVVAGAGVAGLTTAWWLERAGWDVLLIEKAQGVRLDGYMIDLFGPGREVVARMGIVPALERHRAPIRGVTAVDERGRRRGELVVAEDETGDVISLLRGDLVQVLAGAVRSQVRYGMTVEAWQHTGSGVRVLLTDGTVHEADLLVGADGVHSRVRELVFGPEQRFLRYLGFHVAAVSVRDRTLSDRLGESYQVLTTPNRTVGCHSAGQDDVSAYFLYRNENSVLPPDPVGALRSEFGDLGWVTPALLRALPGDLYFDQAAQVEVDLWHRKRVVLVGDACGAVSLFAGHGASLAMSGACVLAQELTREKDMISALVNYEMRMKPVVVRTQEFGRRFTEWMAPSTRWRILARDWLLRLSRWRFLNKMMVRSATPVADDLFARCEREDHGRQGVRRGIHPGTA
ncbi:FAD-dependent oxidoreductase [Lentzea sp. NPDC034063]|uniref:FAD-dependent oxidoreductase n=1 Tax=unclassified Lentzea TaxID=2643253 RepID=UPI0033E3CC89